MQKFSKLSAIAASLLVDNVDTDMIIPKQFLKTITRTGLGSKLFYEMRFDANGAVNPEFILNKAPFNNAGILISGDNFGCGSSREHAPWALADFGIRAVIAESFADIFYNNCFENGILPIILPRQQVVDLANIASSGENFTIDLELQKISSKNLEISFEVDAFKKYCLINGLDTIGLTLKKFDKITTFEAKRAGQMSWL